METPKRPEPAPVPALRSRFWADLASPDFASLDAERTVAVLPVAAVEQHGPHLPLDVDRAIVDGIIQATLPLLPQSLPALFLPTQAVGKSVEHERFRGTLSLRTETLFKLWMDIGASVARSGVRKLILFNSHGGQVSMMDLVARDLRASCGLMVFSSSWYQLPLGDALDKAFSAEERRFGVHAGAIETSLMLALAPQRVDMEKARNFESAARARAAYPVLGDGQSAKLGWQMQDYNPHGAAGDARSATAEKGQALLAAAATGLSGLIADVSALTMSTLSDRVEP